MLPSLRLLSGYAHINFPQAADLLKSAGFLLPDDKKTKSNRSLHADNFDL
jgi:hypothetical protein